MLHSFSIEKTLKFLFWGSKSDNSISTTDPYFVFFLEFPYFVLDSEAKKTFDSHFHVHKSISNKG
jgi:hypothetical protein